MISAMKTLVQKLLMMAVQAIPCGQQLPSKVSLIHSGATTGECQFLDLDRKLLLHNRRAIA